MKQFLLKRCGNANLKGFEIVTDILENYTFPIKIYSIYIELGKKYNLTPQAMQRRIITFKNSCGYKEINNHEFISMLMIEAEK